MPKYVIEREIPGAGNLSADELNGISQKSCTVLGNLGPQIQWVHSYVTDDKIYCLYIAPNEELVREHANQGGFPANSISEVKNIIDPTTAEQHPETIHGYIFWREVYLRPLREIISPVRPKAISASVPGKGTELNVARARGS